jgi:hypothetical protein
VRLEVLDVPSPGLGSYTIDISYDPAVVDPVGCAPDPGGVLDVELCNLDFERNDVNPDVIRVGGFRMSAGATGTVALADITFQAIGASGLCSDLTFPGGKVFELTDTNGPNIPYHVENGSICIGEPLMLMSTAPLESELGSANLRAGMDVSGTSGIVAATQQTAMCTENAAGRTRVLDAGNQIDGDQTHDNADNRPSLAGSVSEKADGHGVGDSDETVTSPAKASAGITMPPADSGQAGGGAAAGWMWWATLCSLVAGAAVGELALAIVKGRRHSR